MIKIVGGVLAFILFVMFFFSMWSIVRKVNYSLSYEKMVQETVIDMVKEECLNEQ